MSNAQLLKAYREAGRVVFAYLAGYSCSSVEPGGAKLDPGSDLPVVQCILGGAPMPAGVENAAEVAMKLLSTYCAGTCTEIYLQNDGQVPDELEVDIPGQDLANIERIQAFLTKTVAGHSDDQPMQTMVAVLRKLGEPGVWKAIDMLAARLMDSTIGSLTRFEVEDTLMAAGMRPSQPRVSMGVSEDERPQRKAPEAVAHKFDIGNTSPLDAMVKEFLRQIKQDWQPGEIENATKYLHDLYRRYGAVVRS